MTLTTHIVAGGAVALLFPDQPATAFFVGLSFHYILDIVPHWDYEILSSYANPNAANESRKLDRRFILDIFRIGFDFLLGSVILWWLWRPESFINWETFFLAVIGAVLPDLLQFIYMRFPKGPMAVIQNIHNFFHAELRLGNRFFIGAVLQIIFIICAVSLVKSLALL